jgi:hypothetical protein
MFDEELEQFLPCPVCQRINSTHDDVCPACGHILHASTIRVRGALLIVLGVLLASGMSYLIVLIASILRHSKDPQAMTRFTGSPAAAAGIFAILSFVLLFGITSIVTGGWMLRYGWRPAKLKRLVWKFGLIFWLTGQVVWLLDLFYESP